ncbi:MAG: SRPBCC family protein [Balneolaceae bacterium]|nr:SRPBCC family protein [Balneolaceae bacterium]
MKALKIIGIVLLVLIALFFLIGLLLPSEVHVEREKTFAAQPEVVFNEVNNFKNWEDWSAWHQMADDMEITYSGPSSGEGASYSWTSETIGNGSQRIIESRPYELIRTELDFEGEGMGKGTWKFTPVNDSTKVVWALDADMGSGIFDKYMGLLMDTMIGSNFEQSLEGIEKEIENMPADTSTVMPDSTMMEADSLR